MVLLDVSNCLVIMAHILLAQCKKLLPAGRDLTYPRSGYKRYQIIDTEYASYYWYGAVYTSVGNRI